MSEDRSNIGPTVAEYALECGQKDWTVRRWIAGGFLKVDRAERPMRIVGGEPPLTRDEFLKRLRPTLAKARPGTFGQTEDGSIQVLRNGRIHEIAFSPFADSVQSAARELEQVLS